MSAACESIAIRGYRDFSRIGVGASSVVYRALQEEFDRYVAVKVLSADDPDDPVRVRFAREKATIGRLGGHPHIVQVFDAGLTADGRPYVAMQLYDGSLHDRIATAGTLQVDEAVSTMAAIADAVQCAHETGILHRDIKPQNVLLSQWGPGLADFGIARATGNLAWSQTLRELTPLHAAPEVFLDERVPDERSDVWSLGSTLFTALAGRPPFLGAPDEPVWKYQARLERESVPRVPRSDIPPELAATVDRALTKDPDRRFASAAEFGAALRGRPLDGPVVGDTTVSRRPSAPISSASPAASPIDDPALPAHVGDVGATVVRPGGPREDAPPPTEPDAPSPRRTRLALLAASAAVGAVVLVVAVTTTSRGGQEPIARIPSLVPSATISTAAAPTDFTAEDHGDVAVLRWTDNSNGTARYAIVYRPVDGPQETVVVEDGTDYTITGLDPSVGYCFRLVAIGVDAQGRQTQSFADTSIRGCTPATPTTAP